MSDDDNVILFQVEHLASLKTLISLQIEYFSSSLNLLRNMQSGLQTQLVFLFKPFEFERTKCVSEVDNKKCFGTVILYVSIKAHMRLIEKSMHSGKSCEKLQIYSFSERVQAVEK